jgi:hypothetical protein
MRRANASSGLAVEMIRIADRFACIDIIGTVAIYDPVFFCRLLGWRGLPHEALDVRCPAELYTASSRPYDGLPELTYPFRDVIVTAGGPPSWPTWRRERNCGQIFSTWAPRDR